MATFEANLEETEQQRALMFSAMAVTVPRSSANIGDKKKAPILGKNSIGTDLSYLFEKLTVECSGKLVHPQWKHFRHMPLRVSDQTRLSNAIWRSWHLQMVKKRQPIYCSFFVMPPGQDNSHKDPQAIVLEGKYWRRKRQAVADEYLKWRAWWRNRRMENAARAPIVMDSNLVLPPPKGEPMNVEWADMLDPVLGGSSIGDNYNTTQWDMDASRMFQPTLEILHPNLTLEDLLDKLEPMEVLFPRSVTMPAPAANQAPLPPISHSPVVSRGHTPPMLHSSGSSPIHQQFDFHPFRTETVEDARGGTFKVPPPLNQQPVPVPRAHNHDIVLPMSVSPTDSFLKKPLQDEPYSQQSMLKQDPHHLATPVSHASSLEALLQDKSPQMSYSQFAASSNFDPERYGTPSGQPDRPQTKVPFGDNLFDAKAQTHLLQKNIDALSTKKSLTDKSFLVQLQLDSMDCRQRLKDYVAKEPPHSNVAQVIQGLIDNPHALMIVQNLLQPQGASMTTSLSSGISPSQMFPHASTSQSVAAEGNKGTRLEDILSGPVPVFEGEAPKMNQSNLPLLSSTVSTPTAPPTSDTPPVLEQHQYLSDSSPSLKSRNVKELNLTEQVQYKEQRRLSHISAEQKRRGNIKQGFERLQVIVSKLSPPSAGKMSKASVILKSIDYLQFMQKERQNQESEISMLQKQIEGLNRTISLYQEQLPVSGAPVTSQTFEEDKRRFREYICNRSAQNYKFWIFGVIIRQLFDTYNTAVSSNAPEELYRTSLVWLEQNCALPQLRRHAMQGLREISSTTSILTNPQKVPQELTEIVQKQQSVHF